MDATAKELAISFAWLSQNELYGKVKSLSVLNLQVEDERELREMWTNICGLSSIELFVWEQEIPTMQNLSSPYHGVNGKCMENLKSLAIYGRYSPSPLNFSAVASRHLQLTSLEFGTDRDAKVVGNFLPLARLRNLSRLVTSSSHRNSASNIKIEESAKRAFCCKSQEKPQQLSLDGIEMLTRLTQLDISFRRIDAPFPDLRKLRKLQSLRGRLCNFTGKFHKAWQHCQNCLMFLSQLFYGHHS